MMKKRAFTLIELLVAIAIIATLTAILFPVFIGTRERARQASCASNMKQLGAAISIYSGDWDEEYPGSGGTVDTSAPVIADSTKSGAAQAEISGAVPQSEIGPSDPPVAGATPSEGKWHDALRAYVGSNDLFRCPSDPSDPYVTDAEGRSVVDDHGRPIGVPSYLLNGWFLDTVNGEKRTLSGVKRPSETIELAEGDRDFLCTISSCVDDDFHPWEPLPNWAPTLASGRHQSRANYLFADGHVRSLAFSQTISPIGATGAWPARTVDLDLYNTN